MSQKIIFMRNQSRFFYHFPKYHMKILLGDFNAKVGRENIFKPTIGNESLHQDSNDNGDRLVNFVTTNNLVVKSTMFPTVTFISTPGPLLMGIPTIKSIMY